MCRKKRDKKRYAQSPVRNKYGADIEAVLQLLRTRLWQIIARNNSEELIDPLVKPLKNSMPYVQNAGAAKPDDDMANIKPTLDEVLPLPKKEEKTHSAPKQEEKKADSKPQDNSTVQKKAVKKTSAKDLIADDSAELPGQMTVDEAITQAEGKGAQAQSTAPTDTAHKPNEVVKLSESEHVTEQNQVAESNHEHAKQPEEAKQPSLWERYITWKVDRANRNDYFDQLGVQVKNKNAACFELLDYLDELQEEYL